MIGFFTATEDDAVIDLVRRSAEIAAPNTGLRIVELEKRSTFPAMDADEFTRVIMTLDACIIDLDHRSVIQYVTEFGSLAAAINNWAGHKREDHDAISALDNRILLLTRRPLFESEESICLRDYYTIMTLAKGTPTKQALTLAQWLGETLGIGRVRAFISFHSAIQPFAHKVATSLRRRGAAVWFDEIDMKAEETFSGAISRGLGWCTHIVMCVDETFLKSGWSKAEYESFLHRYTTETSRFGGYQKPGVIIPLFMVDPLADDLPSVLRQIRGIDCRNISFQKCMNQLWTVISAVGRR